ncbi:secretin N-terminal domain-containing protein [Parachitinimonas caeni]|uniref:Secretin N-terminal domain-containing protein n=1 Tax=Parachitinimonas caeni TaxID=3031301 RepID=A0ABT7E4Z2_9NEIS|nr:secretin N-terminal domain-containing protein [Parachitinimonas caeni]MDK2126443.1 secretin N-terminal domain-containing protein [Parachitinimonas caeni]
MKLPRHTILWGLVLTLGAGCASNGQRTFEQSRQMLAEGRAEEAVLALEGLARSEPNNNEYRSYWLRQREVVVDRFLRDAETQRTNQRFDEAQTSYEKALRLHPDNPRAKDGLIKLEREFAHRTKLEDAAQAIQTNNPERARVLLKQVLSESPRHPRARKMLSDLDTAKNKADLSPVTAASPMNSLVTLEFRNAPLMAVFDVLSQSTGVNFVFDREVRLDGQTTIMARDTPLGDALNVLLATNKLAKRVLNDKTVLIYSATPNRQKDLEALNVKTFYLNNMEAKAAVSLIKTIVKTRDIYADDKLNLVVVRDTPDAIAMAEKLIAANDLAEPEVMLDVEVMEIGSERLSQLGVQFPDQVSLSVPKGLDGGSITWGELRNLSRDGLKVSISDPAVVLNLKHTDGATNTLANPRIRVKNREKAKIHIGDRVPVITTTTNPTSGSVAESVNYLDVGLKLDVEPQIYQSDEVGIRLSLEVSNIVKEVPSKSGLLTYQIGTRTTSTILRLKDGETQVMAGLLKQEEIESASRLPGLGKLPMLGRLFSSEKRQLNKSELVLLITPHVVRNLAIPDANVTEFHSGTDEAIGSEALRLPNRSQISIPASTDGGGAAPVDNSGGTQAPPPPPPPPPQQLPQTQPPMQPPPTVPAAGTR